MATTTAAPDMSIDYDLINGVEAKLQYAVNDLGPQIDQLRIAVGGLLTQDGGLWMDQTSVAIQDVYHNFDVSAVNVVKAFQSFANTFSDFVAKMQAMDKQTHDGILNPPATK